MQVGSMAEQHDWPENSAVQRQREEGMKKPTKPRAQGGSGNVLFDNRNGTNHTDYHLEGPPGRHEPECLITADELCSRLSVSKGWIYKEVKRGALPYIKVGAALRFEWHEVLASLKRQSAHRERE